MAEWKYKPLAQRFVSDYKLPIPIITEDIFKFHLNKYEEIVWFGFYAAPSLSSV